MKIVLGRGEVEIGTGWVSEHDRRRAVFIEPVDHPGVVGELIGSKGGLRPLADGGLMLVIENISGARVLRDTLSELIEEG